MAILTTRNPKETKRFAARLARSLKSPVVLALAGELGAGKTTFVQGFAQALGIKEKIQSPTFVLLKIYNIYSSSLSRRSPQEGSRLRSNNKISKPKHLVHIDCYRLASPRDLAHLGFKNLLKDKDAVILIEWAERIRSLIPRTALWVKFRHGEKPHERILKFRSTKSEIRNKSE